MPGSATASGTLRGRIPKQQGLKLFWRAWIDDIHSLRGRIPKQQGLKHQIFFQCFFNGFSSRAHSKTTRIETQIQEALPAVVCASRAHSKTTRIETPEIDPKTNQQKASRAHFKTTRIETAALGHVRSRQYIFEGAFQNNKD